MANQIDSQGWPKATSRPIPYLTAVWTGMDQEEIVAGLGNGTILVPPGAARGWLPTMEGDMRASLGMPNSAPTTADVPASAEMPGEPAVQPAIDRGTIKHWFTRIDPQLDAASFDSIWAHAGNDDPSRAQTLVSYLRDALLPTRLATERHHEDDSATVTTVSTALDAFVADSSHRARVVDLSGKTGADLAALAQTDIGYRYAITEMQPIALVGNRALYAGVNADGHLDRFDPDTGDELISAEYLGDRAKFMAWSSRSTAGQATAIDANQGWTFVDRSRVGVDGAPVELKLQGRDATSDDNRVVFGNADADVITGNRGTDRMYGGAGDDVLRGAAGADLLEGGGGDDLLLGGRGDDQLSGGLGNDDLDGGSGSDQLTGGSGDDQLSGGRGDDHLEGGSGHDTYLFDAGDGTDTIVDTDGLGEVVIDGNRLTGGIRQLNGQWSSADGQLDYSVEGDLAAGATLTINVVAQGTADDSDTDKAVSIRNWKNGDLGITLAGDQPLADGETARNESPAIALDKIPVQTASQAGADVDSPAAEELGGDNGGGQMASTDASAQVADDAANSASTDWGPEGVSPDTAGSFNFDDAISSLFDFSQSTSNMIDATALRDAVVQFSGPLEVPDVPSFESGAMAGHPTGITANDIADALASDVDGGHFDSEIASASMIASPELQQTAAAFTSFDAGTKSVMHGVSSQAR